ncbi:nuclear transport factor 2 family protein [Mycolicibacterium flavescens]|uniref:DUF4440 domain-containing protein n=1 Tax=Mycolicibacterium flavescens TaxID=1776 RepID=A0A1E3RRJ0_MYCFV|nr:nuclear transport factor 2 family protein [Mycolicibacterium flavescens]MCV7279912.1 nuclear transport factor 2 family protein [Mycolicibacterium flavescens]ODQ92526.1 DUF4440 domain-containing protein [Mycolicibacterium flavescens]
MTTHHIELNDLPAAVKTYLAAHDAGDVDAARDTFTADAAVTDEGHTYHGRDQVVGWLSATSNQYTYTTEYIGATEVDGTTFEVVQHLEGDFPGGVADLRFRFTLDRGLITRLVIEP